MNSENQNAETAGRRETKPVLIWLGRELSEDERATLNAFLDRRKALQVELLAVGAEKVRLNQFLTKATEELPVLKAKASASLDRQDFMEARACEDQIAVVKEQLKQQHNADMALGLKIGKCLPEMGFIGRLLRQCERTLQEETAVSLRPFCHTEDEALQLALQTSASKFCRQIIEEDFTAPSLELFSVMGSTHANRSAEKQEKLCLALLSGAPVATFDWEAMQAPDPLAADKEQVRQFLAERNMQQQAIVESVRG